AAYPARIDDSEYHESASRISAESPNRSAICDGAGRTYAGMPVSRAAASHRPSSSTNGSALRPPSSSCRIIAGRSWGEIHEAALGIDLLLDRPELHEGVDRLVPAGFGLDGDLAAAVTWHGHQVDQHRHLGRLAFQADLLVGMAERGNRLGGVLDVELEPLGGG